MDAKDYLDEINVGRSFDEWIGDPCFRQVFDAVKSTIVANFEECSAEPDGPYELKLMLHALKTVEAAAHQFVERGEIAKKKLERLRNNEQRDEVRTRLRPVRIK